MARAKKFGAFAGVFTPSILTILGVIMYLRLPWIVGQAGLWSTLAIILVAHVISISTGLSVSSVATDKRVGTGGVYYIISRSLGLPIGGTLGLALFVGFSFSVSLYLIGFSETFLNYFGYEVTLDSIRVTGSIALAFVTIVTLISTSLAIKTQYLIMAAIFLSLLSVFLGSHDLVPEGSQLLPLSGGISWIALFAIYFPAVTGFTAGVSMSGDLKDPRKDIPVGTIVAIGVGLVVYVGLAIYLAVSVDREQLVGNPAVLFDISWMPQLVVAGVLGATLSSAVGSVLGAPRILQAISNDRIIPSFFSKGHGPSKEPRNALLFTFVIAQAGILIGELNVLARVVSIFFIIAYGFLNITYAIESWASSDFRPSFKIPRVVSIIGALACIIVMIQLDVLAMIAASIILVFIFLFLKKKELTLQTGDTWNSVWASLVKSGLGRLATSSRKPSNWRPNVILFSGGQKARPYLIEMGKSLVGKLGIFTNFELVENPSDEILLRKDEQILPDYSNQKQRVFTRRHICRDIYEGIDSISKIYGFSGFEPNTILMGWARRTRDPERFAWLLNNFKQLDYNTVFLHYDQDAGFGKYRQIDFWWSGKGRNLSFVLTLLRFMTSSREWRSTCIRILIINRDNSKTEHYYRLIQQILDTNRMTARVKVINNGVEKLPDNNIIHAESSATDLTILELPEGSRKEADQVIRKTNQLTENLNTCLIIQASTFFEEISLPGAPEAGITEEDSETTGKPSAEILQQLEVSSREIIANEVHNIARTYSHHTQKFFEDVYDPLQQRNDAFFGKLHDFAAKTMGNLLNIFALESPLEQNRQSLRLLNDFSYHSQRQIQYLKEQLVTMEKEVLEQSLSQYLSVLRHSISVIPEKLRIRLPREAFSIQPEDGMAVRGYKLWKMTQAMITRRPVVHRITVTPAARHYLWYSRLQAVHAFLTDFSNHTFSEVSGIRKLLSELHQTIEISRLDVRHKHKSGERAKMEKNRLLASVSVMQKNSHEFLHQAGVQLYSALRNDLQQFNNLLDSPGMKPAASKVASLDKKALAFHEQIEDFPSIWQENIGYYINKVWLDFLILSLQNRILSKIRKYKDDLKQELENALLDPMRTYKVEEKNGLLVVAGQQSDDGLLDNTLLKDPILPEFFRPLYEEVSLLIAELPEVIAISHPEMIENMEKGNLESSAPVLINVQKTVTFFLGTELFDKVRKQVDEGHQQIQKMIFTLKDLVRLVNFNLENDPETNDEIGIQQRQEQNKELMQSFHQRIREEQARLITLYRKVEQSFDEGMKQAFEPLSSALISKNNITLKKKVPDQSDMGLAQQVRHKADTVREQARQQFVNMLYSKSEGLLWVSRFEHEEDKRQISNKDFLAYAESMTPSRQVTKELPYYYSSLFSGKSGVGEGFWVGMHDETEAGHQAVQRFVEGTSGALIVSGERSSGKSSLCKLIARKHFPAASIYSVKAPKAATADVEVFKAALLNVLGAHNTNLEDVFSALPPHRVFIINDLELWWERKPHGLAVVHLIQQLIDQFGNKCLFIINCNTHAFNIINNATDLRSYALDTIICNPFDARELKEIIMLRHQAGGLRFVLDNKAESRMTAWDYARLFNNYFDLSGGNPGSAITLWLASIKKISGKTLIMETIKPPAQDILAQLNQEQLFYLLQFALHRRLTVQQLAESLQMPHQVVVAEIRKLLRMALLDERFEGVYGLNNYLEYPIINNLKSLNLL